MPEYTRKPAMGLNSNPSRDGVEYHVQTEDLPLKSKIRTQIFVDGGVVIFTDHYEYREHLDKVDLGIRLIKVMRACHQRVVAGVQNGTLLPAPATPASSRCPAQPSSVVRKRNPSDVWDSLVKEAHRRNMRVRMSTRPPPAWDRIVENLRRSG
jgi:hypothetical protein